MSKSITKVPTIGITVFRDSKRKDLPPNVAFEFTEPAPAPAPAPASARSAGGRAAPAPTPSSDDI